MLSTSVRAVICFLLFFIELSFSTDRHIPAVRRLFLPMQASCHVSVAILSQVSMC